MENPMVVKRIYFYSKLGLGRDMDISRLPQVENVDFKDKKFFDALNQKGHPDHEAGQYIIIMSFSDFLAIIWSS